MARPKICDEPRVATAVRLPLSLHHGLRQAALERDVSVNLLVTRAVEDLLTRLPAPLADATAGTPAPPGRGSVRR